MNMQWRNQILTVWTVLTLAAIFSLQSESMAAQTTPDNSTDQPECRPTEKYFSPPVKLRSGKVLEAHALKPVFESLAQSLAKSPLGSLCEATPRFECWDRKGIPDSRLEFIELSKTRVLMRVSCSTGAYNSSSYYVAFGTGTSSSTPGITIAKRGRTKNSPGGTTPGPRRPALILFPHHPGLLNGPHAFWGIKPLEAIVSSQLYDPKNHSLFLHNKGLADGTIGHFHQYVFSTKDGLPRLKLSVSKILDDGEGAFHFNATKSRFPPMTSTWVRFKPTRELRGCLSDFQEFECSKIIL